MSATCLSSRHASLSLPLPPPPFSSSIASCRCRLSSQMLCSMELFASPKVRKVAMAKRRCLLHTLPLLKNSPAETAGNMVSHNGAVNESETAGLYGSPEFPEYILVTTGLSGRSTKQSACVTRASFTILHPDTNTVLSLPRRMQNTFP